MLLNLVRDFETLIKLKCFLHVVLHYIFYLVQSYDMPKENDLYKPWRIHKLVKRSDVTQAQALIYDVYVREMGWMFAKDNPTGKFLLSISCVLIVQKCKIFDVNVYNLSANTLYI